MKIYITDKIDCPYCECLGYFTINNHGGNPEWDESTDCPMCKGTGELDNKSKKYDELRKISQEMVRNSAEMAKVASEYYNAILKQCLDMDHALVSGKYVEDRAVDSYDDLDVECQELKNMFEAFDVKRTSFLEMLNSCSGDDDYQDAKNFDIDRYYAE